MTRRTIPGRLDAAGMALLVGHIDDDSYRQRADQHRPGLEGLRVEALRLLGTGLSPRDVAQALRVGEDVVQTWIAAGWEGTP